MVHFQDSLSSSMRKSVCMFGLIVLPVERVSAHRCGWGLSLLPGWFSLSEGFFAHTHFLCNRAKESDFKVLENTWNKWTERKLDVQLM